MLGASLITEGSVLLLAINAIRKGALEQKMSFREYGGSQNDGDSIDSRR